MPQIKIIILGGVNTGKTTVATLIQKYLKTLGFDVSYENPDRELPPCPTNLRKRTRAIQDNGTELIIEEKSALRSS